MKAAFFENRPRFKSKLSRTVAFLCATLALHYIFLESAGRQNWTSTQQIIDPVPLSVHLQAIDNSPRELSVIRARSSTAGESRKSAMSKAGKARAEAKAIPTLTSKDIEQEFKLENPEPVHLPEVATASNPDEFILRLPPSAEIDMEVSYAKANESPTRGAANLVWNSTTSSYSLSLKVSVDLFVTTINLLQLNSEGLIGQFGLAPTKSEDTRRSRATTAIHFNHSDKTIVFSSSNKTVKMEDGAQDALSILMQLATIGNSDPKRLMPGKDLTIQVAEGRDASNFTFHVVAEEELPSQLSSNGGTLRALHLIRPPKPGSYNSTLEIWLAPERSWYPVQIRNTESSGTVTNQRVTAIRQIERLAQ